MNILILAAAPPAHDGDYPLLLTELDGVPLIELILKACAPLNADRIVFALREHDVRRYHLDNIVELLAPGSAVLRVSDKTRGAACTALLAAGIIDNDEELLVINGDSLHDVAYADVIANFRERQLAAGTLIFPSIHPRYSYVRLNGEQLVVEAAEKNPISRNATAGFYWYAHGRQFVAALKNMIRKDAQIDGRFFICPAFNEMVLAQLRIGCYAVEARQYHQLKTEKQLNHYEALLDSERRW